MPDQNPQSDQDLYSRIAAQCICANLRRTSRTITQLYDQYLQPSGLLGTQFRLLGALASRGPIPLTPLADLMALDRTTLARNLKPLERDGLLETTTGDDRRTRLVSITDKGRAALARALPLWEQAQASIISQLGEDRSRELLAGWSDLVALAHQP